MKNTGIVRRIDDLGRIVIPKEIRRVFKIAKNEAIEMFVENNYLILKKFNSFVDSGKLKDIAESLAQSTNLPVIICGRNEILAAARISVSGIDELLLSNTSEFFNETKAKVSDSVKILGFIKGGYLNFIAAPVLIESNVEYVIFVLSKEKKPLTAETELASLTADIIAKI